MERAPAPLVIDACPRGPRVPLASEAARGRPLLDPAAAQPCGIRDPIALVICEEAGPLLRASVEGHLPGRFAIASGLPELGDLALRAAIAWRAFARTAKPARPIAGILDAMRKHLRHAWIAPAVLGRLRLLLAESAAYFPARASSGALRRAVCRG